ncbi:MAG: sodium:solute symporter family protein [Candidatus Zixiibacteriota bacterium]
MHLVDYLLIVVYLAALLILGFTRRLRADSSASDLIVGGRVLTLPAFVASLVSTWYGGILGVGEYSYRFGLSNWLVFGLPYYVAAFLFAMFLARRARQSKLLTIPDRLAQAYDNKTAVAGSIIIYFMTVPAAYILMIGTLCQYLFGWPFWVGVLCGTSFSVVYVYFGGFNSVVRTDLFQFALMFLGFLLMLVVLASEYGGIEFLRANVPAVNFTWHGGNPGMYIAIWYFIALATLIEPTFYQRCYAAKNMNVARTGILVSIGCWAFFDFLTTSCGLYARAILPDLASPVGSYPALGLKVLPVGLLGLFALALLATVMSTIDSYSFVAASTFSRDIVMRLFRVRENRVTYFTRLGLVVTVVIAVVIVLFFRSVVDIWHIFGSVGTPALLVPVFFSFVGKRRLPSRWAFVSVVFSGMLSLAWYLSRYSGADGVYWLGVEPIFPGLVVSVLIFVMFGRRSADKAVAK